jgi:hypothetical protein
MSYLYDSSDEECDIQEGEGEGEEEGEDMEILWAMLANKRLKHGGSVLG